MEKKDTKTCDLYDWQVLSAYMDGGLASGEREEIKKHVNECRDCLNALAYYYTSSIAMDEAVASGEAVSSHEFEDAALKRILGETEEKEESRPPVVDKEPAPSLTDWLGEVLGKMNPFALPVPTLALTVILLIGVVSVFNRDNPQGNKIIRITGTDRFGSAGGSLGFAPKGEYNGMVITSKGEFVEFSWKDLPTDSEYRFTVTDISVKREKVYSETLKKPLANLKSADLKAGKRYQWKVSGKEKDGEQFVVKGEFVKG